MTVQSVRPLPRLRQHYPELAQFANALPLPNLTATLQHLGGGPDERNWPIPPFSNFSQIGGACHIAVPPDPPGRDCYFDSTRPRRPLASRASRAAVRFLAAASEAFLARAERCSAVIVFRLRLPPIFPPLRPSSAMISDSSAAFCLFIQPS